MSSLTAPLDDYRIHAPPDARPRHGGEFVLYWMQTTQRAHDNFALNFAIEQADALGLPLQVYHGLRHDYPWASDRFHTWILEGVIDLYAGFAARGINYAFWLDEGTESFTQWPAGNRPQAASGRQQEAAHRTHLADLADRAALVVTDFFPTFIVPRQIRSLRGDTATPVIAVDSATLVPMAYHKKEHGNARGIRTVLMEALPHYLWPVDNPSPRVQRSIHLPFDPVRPTREMIAALVARCDIDHAVAPSPMFRGGTAAGRARLTEFVKNGLKHYADLRNDPNEPEAVSRLSPYLHFGNLSIHEILLAAQAAGPADQYAKFLDEALTWREVSHNFCYFNPKHRTPEGMPAWAREQLAEHESDPRPELYSDEELEFAKTGDELWNAAQRSYLRDGWMHNYMRMLWGKAVLQWTPNAAECLRVLEHLNNKYSLDGRDPNSYGGIMWTFGKFDRPFYRRPVYGTVRYQSLKAARDKFDVPRYIRAMGG
jgi:deoxyribodipyrimidine photo-lyase